MNTETYIEIEQRLALLSEIEKVDTLLSLFSETYTKDYQKATHYASHALRIAKKINEPERLGNALIAKIKVERKKGHYDNAVKFGNQAIKILKPTPFYEQLVKVYNLLGLTYLKT